MSTSNLNPQSNLFVTLTRAFPGIHPGEVETMLGCGSVRTYPAGYILCHEGAVESTFYIILGGNVQVTKLLNGAEARFLKRLSSGDFFGEMALLHNAPRAATVATTTEVTVLEISKEQFSNLVESSSSISLAMVREVSRRLRSNDEMAIEDLRQRANELAEAYQQLAEQEFARKEFLTTVAHELRTPLMAANGFLQVIRTGMVQGEAFHAALDTVARNVQDIITLTNDILFLQELELILPEFKSVDIARVVAAAVEQQRGRATRSRIGLSIQVAPGLPDVNAAPNGLERVVAALLDNAIKFSPEGGSVTVQVGQKADRVYISIQDQGVGIPPEALPRIFDRFFHLEQVGGHLFRGIGLGLAIARHVVEQHHGQIEVESQLGKGSTFTVWLNAAQS